MGAPRQPVSDEPVGSAPTGTVTFLFTDIEGSTRLLDALGDGYAAALEEHRERILRAVDAGKGHRMGCEGDACFAAFARASDAIAAALAAQRALADSTWSHAGEVPVRMGLHTGEAELTSAGYVGLAVHKAARVRSAAHGRQVLLSGATAELVARNLPDGAELEDLGNHRLKDLGQPERLLQLVHPDLQRTFPRPSTLDVAPNNLPLQLTSFVGRVKEIDELTRLVGSARLVTVIGPGGSGKTRLALQVAADLVDRHPEGVWFVDLAATSDGHVIPETLAAILGGRARRAMPMAEPEPERTPLERVIERLRNSTALLVLDNCEHLIADCAAVAEALLRACPSIGILATSREPLRIPGEARWRLAPLSVPADQSSEPIVGFDAVRLFVDRARLNQSDFALTPANAPTVAEICRRLDGMPLAIELAAAWVSTLDPAQILDRLDDQFRLLATGPSRGSPRQQTLRATVDWSYDLLSDAERRVLENLSVFAGGFSLEAAEHVAAGDGVEQHEVLSILSNLVDKSLVIRTGSGARQRYRLLEVIREYAWQRVEDSADATAPLVAATGTAQFLREGDHWAIGFAPDVVRVRAAKGMTYLSAIVAAEGRELHVFELVGDSGGGGAVASVGDAGALLDDTARAAYKQRLGDLEAEADDARTAGSASRLAAAQEEIDFLVAELSRAFGIGGRERRAASSSERARTSVTKAISTAIRKIEEQDPVIGGHLRTSVRTGTYCGYRPDPTNRITWALDGGAS